MEQIQMEIKKLEKMLTPSTEMQWGEKIFPPNEKDFSAQANLKRELIELAHKAIKYGNSIINGTKESKPIHLEKETDNKIESIFSADPEKNEFKTLYIHIQNIVDYEI